MASEKSREYQRQWRKANKEKLAAYVKEYRKRPSYKAWKAKPEIQALTKTWQRRARLKHTYGLTEEQYNALLMTQDGRCAICRVPQLELTNRLVVDHDHKSGVVRGLLCSHCNITLVSVFDSYGSLIPATLRYLGI